MTRWRDWFRPPRHVLVIFLGVAVVCATALGWLGWLLLEQDTAVESQRRRERLDEGADRAVAVMQRWLADLETPSRPLEGVTLVTATKKGITANPPLPFLPEPASLPEAPTEIWAEGERLEFAAQDLRSAARFYEAQTASPDSAVSAGALARVARVYRKLGETNAAERAYKQLAQLPDASVGGLPSGLIAGEGLGRTGAAALYADLANGRWQLTRQQFEFYSSEAAQRLGKPIASDADVLARAEALTWLWNNRPPAGSILRRLVPIHGATVLLIAKPTTEGLQAVIAGPHVLEDLCREAVPGAGLQWALTDPEGRAALGQAPPARDVAIRTAVSTGLPWTLHVFRAGPQTGMPSRRRLLLWVFAVLAVVLSAGTYFILRAISQELRVARLQSDFVAAVSHEFRSPLSSLSQIAEMLARDRFSSEEQRRKSYTVLESETERLRRLVEGLLDFGRFEAGASSYRFEEIEAGAFVRDLVSEFQARIAQQGYVIELNAPPGPLHLRADREALARAIWNLLDNAVKYSPECHTVWVDLECTAACVSITVRDQGLGIPAHEQRQIFNKFVRGAESKARRIKGTGIGLAMVRHIVQAHGGEIRVASEPGRGSRFVMVLQASGGVS